MKTTPICDKFINSAHVRHGYEKPIEKLYAVAPKSLLRHWSVEFISSSLIARSEELVKFTLASRCFEICEPLLSYLGVNEAVLLQFVTWYTVYA